MTIYSELITLFGLPISPYTDVIYMIAVLMVFLLVFYGVVECLLMLYRFVIGGR